MGRHKTGRSALSLTTSDGLGSGDRLFVMIDASSIFAGETPLQKMPLEKHATCIYSQLKTCSSSRFSQSLS